MFRCEKVDALRLAWPQKVNALSVRDGARVENFVGKILRFKSFPSWYNRVHG